jgi:hypothetical protein
LAVGVTRLAESQVTPGALWSSLQHLRSCLMSDPPGSIPSPATELVRGWLESHLSCSDNEASNIQLPLGVWSSCCDCWRHGFGGQLPYTVTLVQLLLSCNSSISQASAQWYVGASEEVGKCLAQGSAHKVLLLPSVRT